MPDPVPARLPYPGSGGHLGRPVVELRVEAGDSNLTASSAALRNSAASPRRLKQISLIQPRSPATFAGVERQLILSIDGLGDIILSSNSVSG